MEKSKIYYAWLIALLAVFFFLISMLAISYMYVTQGNQASGVLYLFVHYHIQLMIVLGVLGIGVGIISYYSFVAQQQTVVQTQKSSKEIILRFLDDAEKIIIEQLSTKEHVVQSELSRNKQLGKVKTFRTLQRLEAKGLIKLSPHGKTNMVSLTPEIKEIL